MKDQEEVSIGQERGGEGERVEGHAAGAGQTEDGGAGKGRRRRKSEGTISWLAPDKSSSRKR